jgi:hypothetical protein
MTLHKLAAASGGSGAADYPKAFTQHGVHFTRRSGDQAVGDCPFCGSSGHFYVNVANKRWDCKAGGCQMRGGFVTFLDEVYKRAQAAFTGKEAKALADFRGLQVSTFQEAGVGWWAPSGRYILPVRYRDGTDRLFDLRHYRIPMRANEKCKVMSTAGCDLALLGWEELDGNPHEVWVAEGDWDRLSMREAKVPGVVVGVPGAGTWKADWADLLRGCKVHLLYDNDAAGVDGAYRAYRALHGIAASIDVINWPQGLEVGWDISDEYVKHGASGFLQRVKALLKPFPPGAESVEAILTMPQTNGKKPTSSSAQVRAVSKVGEPSTEVNSQAKRVTPAEIHALYRKWLYLPDATVLDIVFACAIANRLPGDPLWLFIVAPPGGTKTVPLLALEGAAYIVATTSVTPPALISGASFGGGADPSLLARFQGEIGKVLVVKDFTTILQMPPMIRDEVFGILRDAYDGKIEKRFGNGVHRRYECHFGLMAGVTPSIEQYMEQSVGLGERFLSYRTPIPESMSGQREFLRKAQSNVGREQTMQKELAEMARTVLRFDYVHGRLPRIPPSIGEKLIDAAQIVALARGSVTRDRYTKEVTHKPFSELGTRLVKQLTKWALGLAMLYGRTTVSEVEYRTVVRMATGSCPSGTLSFIKKLYSDTSKGFTTEQAAEATGLPAFPTGERILENLHMLGVVERSRVQGLKTWSEWRLKTDVAEAIDRSEVLI